MASLVYTVDIHTEKKKEMYACRWTAKELRKILSD